MRDDEHDVVGSLAEEAAKLFGAMSDNLGEHLDTGSPDCDWCPVCRGARVVRELSPEVTAHLAVAAASIAQAVAALMATSSHTDRPASGPDVEHIDLDDSWPDD